MMLMTMWMGGAVAEAADPDRLKKRLERQVARRSLRTEDAHECWEDACAIVTDSPDDRKTQRKHERAETKLVNLRARQVEVERQLDALGTPEASIEVFFATNRETWSRDGQWYRARDAGRLEYGIATVHIPEDHPVGALEKDLEIRAVDILDVAVWEERLARAVVEIDAEILVNVHGYNNSFDYATRRSGQVGHDLDRPVVPVLFSWPANGGTWFAGAKYIFDENAAARSSPDLAEVLMRLLTLHDTVSVFAHSLGSRVLSDALLDMELMGGAPRGIHQMVFAAPDIDASVFDRRYADLAAQIATRVTVYCAADDRALKLSRGVHGGYDRLGTCRPEAVAAIDAHGIEVIDASRLHSDMLDHDKVASSPRLLGDLGLVLGGLAAQDRDLVDRGDRFELPP